LKKKGRTIACKASWVPIHIDFNLVENALNKDWGIKKWIGIRTPKKEGNDYHGEDRIMANSRKKGRCGFVKHYA